MVYKSAKSGLNCPKCNSPTYVKDSRARDNNTATWRERQCSNQQCLVRFFTMERVEEVHQTCDAKVCDNWEHKK